MENNECCCRKKSTPRTEEEQKILQNRINRIIGQMNGIKNMIDDNRYCGDIIIQISAIESALKSLGYIIMQNHLDTCVIEEIKKGNGEIMQEVTELFKRIS